MDVEVDGIVNAMSQPVCLNIGMSKFYIGEFDGQRVVVAQSGIGKVNAAFITSVLINKFDVDCILVSGIAGSAKGLKTMDCFVPTKFVQHDVSMVGEPDGKLDILNCITIDADEYLVDMLISACSAQSGVMATGEQFICTPSQLDAILKKFPEVKAVDMEAGAIAQVCKRVGIPMACLKVISDGSDEGEYFDFKQASSQKTITSMIACIKALAK